MNMNTAHHHAFTQSGANTSATFNGDYNDVRGNQDNSRTKTIAMIYGRRAVTAIGHDQIDSRTSNVYHGLTIHVHTSSAPGVSLQQTISEGVASALNSTTSNDERQIQVQAHSDDHHQQAVVACGDVSGLMISTILLLANRSVSSSFYRDMKLFFRSLNCTILATKQALQTFHFTPLGRNLAKTVKPTIFACREILQALSDTLGEPEEGHSFAVIRNIWSIALWSGSEEEGFFIIRRKLFVHQTALREFLAALNSISWTVISNELTTGAISFQKLRTFLQSSPLRLDHIVLSQLLVIDHLGTSIPVPNMFCSSWEDFRYIVTGYCKGRAGVKLVERGDFRIIHSDDNQEITSSTFVNLAKPGTIFEMSIVLRQEQNFEMNKNKCPRCRCINGSVPVNGWIECKKCSGKFKVDGHLDKVTREDDFQMDDSDGHGLEEVEVKEALTVREDVISPASSQIIDDPEAEVDEIPFFRRIQVLCIENSLQVPHGAHHNQDLLKAITSLAGQPPVQPTEGFNQTLPSMTFPLRARPTLEQVGQAGEWVERAKSEFLAQSIPIMKTYPVPDEQREICIEMMHHLHRVSAEFEGKLPMFFYVVQDAHFIRRIIAIVLVIQEQMKIFRSGDQKHILAPQNIPILTKQLTAVNEQFHVAAPWMKQYTSPAVQLTQGSNQAPPSMTFPLRVRPTLEQVCQAGEWVQRAKSEFLAQSIPIMKTYPVPDGQREICIEMMHHLHRVSAEFEGKLPMFFYVVQDAHFVRKILAIVLVIQEQMKIFRSGGQKHILAPQNIPILTKQLTAVNEQLHVAMGWRRG